MLGTLSEVAYSTYDYSCKVFFDIQKDQGMLFNLILKLKYLVCNYMLD